MCQVTELFFVLTYSVHVLKVAGRLVGLALALRFNSDHNSSQCQSAARCCNTDHRHNEKSPFMKETKGAKYWTN